ncbi:MAG: hypothetical protein ABIE68_02100 [bacterium]
MPRKMRRVRYETTSMQDVPALAAKTKRTISRKKKDLVLYAWIRKNRVGWETEMHITDKEATKLEKKGFIVTLL